MTENKDNRGFGGILTKLKALLENNRIGELLVARGILTPQQLEYALVQQRESRDHLGRVLVREKLVSRQDLRRTLAQQWTLRCLAATVGIFISFSSFGGVKNARAGTIKDVPAQMQLVSAANEAFAPVSAYPALFGAAEKRSGNLEAFTKWTGMFKRFDRTMAQSGGQEVIGDFQRRISRYQGMSLDRMASGINDLVNETKYIVDSRNWGQSDYWATPIEFFTRGGDCEDFAIAKYTALRALGVPEERLRIVIVHDEIKDIPHAVLVVYTDTQALILDNQTKSVQDSSRVSRYRPIFSINRDAWWLHTKGQNTVLASAK